VMAGEVSDSAGVGFFCFVQKEFVSESLNAIL